MANLSGQNVCDEVAFRISNRLAANGTGAGSIINFTNDILGLISSAGSWVWDQTSITGATPANLLALSNCDVGKKISIFNSLTGTPVGRVTQDEYASSSVGYVGIGATPDWNTFRTTFDSFSQTGIVQLFGDPSAAGNVDIYYHLLPPTLVYGASPTVRWTSTEMNDLIKDWTTAKSMQWLNLAGWDAAWVDCKGRLGELRRMYTTERIDMGPEDEAKGAMAEKNTVGRE